MTLRIFSLLPEAPELRKVLPITYANLRACLDFASNRYRLTPNDRLTQTFDQTFDLSIFDLLMAWTGGACVYPIPPVELFSPINFVNRHQITLCGSPFHRSQVVSIAKRGALRSGCMPSLRWSLFCGEGLPRGDNGEKRGKVQHRTLN